MPEYRRFISYIYDYQKGRKGSNCGFARIEVRNGNCRVFLHLQPVGAAGGKLEVYGFVRTGGKILGILLGSAGPQNGVYEVQTNTPADSFAQSGYPVGEIRGIWIKTRDGEDYITIWDDEPVDLGMFVTEPPEAEAAEVVVTAEEEPEPGETKADGEVHAGAAGMEMGDQVHTGPSGMKAGRQVHTGPSGMEAGRQVRGRTSGREDLSRKLAQRWENFLYHYPHAQPFGDDEIFSCVSIAPKDISFLQREEWQYMNNPFLQQGYGKYRHLLLGCHRDGRFILGVPGVSMDMQDHHLARMCGFPLFKEAIQPEEVEGDLDKGSFGYWYHFLNEECPE